METNQSVNQSISQSKEAQQPLPKAEKQDTPWAVRLKSNYSFFGWAGAAYAVVYAFCMYRNASGITHPFFVIGSLFFYCFCMKRLEISVKKDSVLYMAAIGLLAVSTFCTADGRLIAMNKTGIFFLTISLLLHQFYKDEKWRLGKYLGAICLTVFGSIGELARPFTDAIYYGKKKNGKSGKGTYIAAGAAITLPLLAIIWALLANADQVFGDMTEKVFQRINLGDIIGIGFTIFFMFMAYYCILAYLCDKRIHEEAKERRQTEAVLAIVVTLPLTVLYVVFSLVQIVCLFMGRINTVDYTYAEYARQGFFQLLFVCLINVVLVQLGVGHFRKNRALNIILTVMSVCTYIMIASSAMRMILYIRYYYLTFLRLFVLWALAVLFLLLTGVLLSVYKREFPVFRYSVAVITVCYILFSFAHPDYWIAKCNIGQIQAAETAGEDSFFRTDSYGDYAYLSRLSADAAPVLIPYLAEQGYDMDRMKDEEQRTAYHGSRQDAYCWGYYYMEPIYDRMQRDGIRQFNLSRYVAGSYLQKYE